MKRILLVLGGGLFLTASLSLLNDAQAGGRRWQGRSLVTASPHKVGQVAIEFTQSIYRVIDGTPQVVLARPVIAEDFPSLGLGQAEATDTGLMLVILKGNFDMSNMQAARHSRQRNRPVKFVAYMFNLSTGVPVLTMISWNGGLFRTILNDPTLPDDGLDAPVTTAVPNIPTVGRPPSNQSTNPHPGPEETVPSPVPSTSATEAPNTSYPSP
jgi:hypothetical protein